MNIAPEGCGWTSQNGSDSDAIYSIGIFHIDLTKVRAAEGKLYLAVAIDGTSQFAIALALKTVKMAALQFLQDLIAAVPYPLRNVLTD
ncbi:hypothetical protein QCN27_05730 [Cereibacter sp. SYSU M97828]|nr:hypothetical protein [Cereibacter flavus]